MAECGLHFKFMRTIIFISSNVLFYFAVIQRQKTRLIFLSEDFLGFERMSSVGSNELQAELIEQLKRIKERIMQDQSNYQRDVHRLYETMQPFGRKPRDRTQKSLEQELSILLKMVGHCIVLDSPSILYQYAIEPIRNNPRMLSHFDDMEMYITPFTNRYKQLEKKSDPSRYSERLFLGKLVSELQLVANGSIYSSANQASYPSGQRLNG